MESEIALDDLFGYPRILPFSATSHDLLERSIPSNEKEIFL
jgi:hypothetical protein